MQHIGITGNLFQAEKHTMEQCLPWNINRETEVEKIPISDRQAVVKVVVTVHKNQESVTTDPSPDW